MKILHYSPAFLPHVGGLEDAQVEAIVALRPDLVLTATSTRAIARLESLGLLRVDAPTTMVRGAPLERDANARLFAIVTQALG